MTRILWNGRIIGYDDPPPPQRRPLAPEPKRIPAPQAKSHSKASPPREVVPPHWQTEIAFHEAAHAVAACILGLKIEKMEIWDRNGLVKTDRKRGPTPFADPFAHAITLLAGNEWMRQRGLPDAHEDDGDFTKAAVLIAEQFHGRREAAKEAFGVVLEATRSLVASDRFQILAAFLTNRLIESPHGWHYGPEIERFLREHDPEPAGPLEAHSTTSRRREDPPIAPWYEVTDRTRGHALVYRGADHAEAKAVQARTPGSMLVGSLYG
jgi:hypothetical protein